MADPPYEIVLIEEFPSPAGLVKITTYADEHLPERAGHKPCVVQRYRVDYPDERKPSFACATDGMPNPTTKLLVLDHAGALRSWAHQKLQEWTALRGQEDWPAADALRTEMLRSGIQLESTLHGPDWRIAYPTVWIDKKRA